MKPNHIDELEAETAKITGTKMAASPSQPVRGRSSVAFWRPLRATIDGVSAGGDGSVYMRWSHNGSGFDLEIAPDGAFLSVWNHPGGPKCESWPPGS